MATKVNFQRDKALEIKFDRTLKAILGNYFITKDIEADLKKASDFLIYNIKPFNVGVRLRRYKAYLVPSYREQFTLRWERPSGVNTEIHKVLSGYVDYILYGFLNEEESKIIQYFIGDLQVFRDFYCSPFRIYSNKPYEDSKLAAWNLNQFPKDFIKYSYHKR